MIETRYIKEGDFKEYGNSKEDSFSDGFWLFGGFDFSGDYGKVALALVEDGRDIALAYIWNVDSIAGLDEADYIEICLMETYQKGCGNGRRFVEMLKERYSRIGAYDAVAEEFWSAMGFNTESISTVDETSRVQEWKR